MITNKDSHEPTPSKPNTCAVRYGGVEGCQEMLELKASICELRWKCHQKKKSKKSKVTPDLVY